MSLTIPGELNARRSTSALDVTLVVIAILLTALGVYGFIEDRGCESACGSDAERATRSALLLGTAMGGVAAGVLGARGSRLTSVVLLAAALVCFVIALGQGLSNLS